MNAMPLRDDQPRILSRAWLRAQPEQYVPLSPACIADGLLRFRAMSLREVADWLKGGPWLPPWKAVPEFLQVMREWVTRWPFLADQKVLRKLLG